MKSSIAPIALTMGEPAGIGGECAVRAWQALHTGSTPFFLLDDPTRIRGLVRQFSEDIAISEIGSAQEARNVFATALPVLPVRLDHPATLGQPDGRNSKAVISSIEQAVSLTTSGETSAIVTNPIQKSTLYEAGFSYPGHTEFLGALAGETVRPVMMLACPELRVVPVTVHVSLREAIASLTTERIVEDATIAWQALRQDFGIASPRLVVAGLNPHAGESGAMGDEETRLILPAIAQLCARGIDASGPYPSDTLFTTRKRPTYDAAICMYHDQALIPVKTLAEDGGVNVTLGLPFVRTSPDHGTALDIADKGIADPASLIAAIRMAGDIARQRQRSVR
ncbi:MAG: 4-hydroxythreonine-4-phosphate dehydrogenase PdxA [Rhizobiaceae bacterium]